MSKQTTLPDQEIRDMLDKAPCIYDSALSFEVAGNGTVARSIFFNEDAVQYCLGVAKNVLADAVINYVRNYIDQQALAFHDLTGVHFFVNPRKSSTRPGHYYLEIMPCTLSPITKSQTIGVTPYPRAVAYTPARVPTVPFPDFFFNEHPWTTSMPTSGVSNRTPFPPNRMVSEDHRDKGNLPPMPAKSNPAGKGKPKKT